MRKDVHGGYLWVAMCLVGPKGMMGHGNEAWGGTDSPVGKALGVLCMQNTQQNNTTKQEIPMVVVLTNGHTGHN